MHRMIPRRDLDRVAIGCCCPLRVRRARKGRALGSMSRLVLVRSKIRSGHAPRTLYVSDALVVSDTAVGMTSRQHPVLHTSTQSSLTNTVSAFHYQATSDHSLCNSLGSLWISHNCPISKMYRKQEPSQFALSMYAPKAKESRCLRMKARYLDRVRIVVS